MSHMLDVLSVLKRRVHHDAIIFTLVLQKIFERYNLAVPFGSEHALECEISFDGCDSDVRILPSNRVNDVALSGARFQDAIGCLNFSEFKHPFDHWPRRGEEARQVLAAEFIFG